MDRLTAARIQTVRDHMRLECESDWDGVIATFAHPRYELYGAGTVFDGEAAVRGYFAASRIPFPDQANEIIAIAADGDSVLVEFWLTGTHLGPLRTPKGEIAPTGRAFRVRMMASFEFAAGFGQDRLRASVLRPARGGHGAGAGLKTGSEASASVARRSAAGLAGTGRSRRSTICMSAQFLSRERRSRRKKMD